MPRTEVRKECPSCGLGVPLDEKNCEFCGWNFDEEDEWITQIDKLEQELITKKQKYDDTSVDKMIKSTLRKPEGKEDEVRTEAAPTSQVVKMKKMMRNPPQLLEVATAVNESTASTVTVDKEHTPAPSGPVISKPKSFRIDVAKIPTPDKNLNQELDVNEPKISTEPKVRPVVAKEKPAAAEPSAPTKPVAAPPTATEKKDKIVRRVVRHDGQPKPMMAKGEARNSVPAKAAAPAVAQQKPAPEKQKPSVAAEKTITAPAKDEKKSRLGGFGKIFSDKKDEKAHNSAPEKLHHAPSKEPVKQTIKVFVCPLCNKEVFETEKKCPNCGAEFE